MVPQMFFFFFCIYLVKSDGCITRIYLYAQTSGQANAGSNSDATVLDFDYLLDGNKKTITYNLYDLPGNDMDKNKGSLWDYAAPAGCISVEDFRSMVISTYSNDGWNIETVMTFGVYDDDISNTLFLFTHDYSIYGWVDNTLTPPSNTVSLKEEYVQRDNCKAAKECINRILITAYTGNVKNAGSNGESAFQLKYGSTVTRTTLYDRSGNDKNDNQGDLWDYEAEGFGLRGCVTFDSISEASFIAESKDGWYIKDAFITVELEQSGDFAFLAGDRFLDKWLDSNGEAEDKTVFLTLRNRCSNPLTMDHTQFKDERRDQKE